MATVSAHRQLAAPLHSGRAVLRHHLAPVLLYTLLALGATWPLALQFATAVPGDGVDSWGNIWNMWSLRQAMLGLRNPFHTTALYAPDGASLLLHTLNPFNFLVSLPVHAAFGLIVAYNFVVVLSLAASGYATYLLAADVTGNRRAAVVAGVVFLTSGYLVSQAMGHLNLIAAQWLPLAALALRRAARAPRATTVAAAALCVAINVLCDWQYFVFALIWGGWHALYLALEQRSARPALPVAAALALACAVTLPLAAATAREALRTPAADTGEAHRIEHSADLADFLLPSQLSPLWGGMAARAQGHKESVLIQNKTSYLGVAALALAALALRRPEARFWAASLAVFCVLSLGPVLHVAGHSTGIPLPAALLYEVPFMRIFRFPMRFVVLGLLALAVLAAIATHHLLMRPPAPGRRRRLPAAAVTGLLTALIIIDTAAVPYPTVGVYVPRFYERLAREPGSFAILESPFYARTSVEYMFFQTIHGKPMVGGYLARQLPYPTVEGLPILRMFAYVRPERDIIAQDPAAIAPSVFSALNIRYLILHSEGGALRYNTLQRVAEAAAGGQPPERETIPGRSFLAYRVAPPERPLPFAGLGGGWSAVEPLPDGGVQRRIGSRAEIVVYNPGGGEVTLALQVRGARPGTVRLEAAGRPASTKTVGESEERVAVTVAAGTQRATVQVDATGVGGATVTRIDIQP